MVYRSTWRSLCLFTVTMLFFTACYTIEPANVSEVLEMTWQGDHGLWTSGIGWVALWDVTAEEMVMMLDQTRKPSGKENLMVAEDNTLWVLEVDQMRQYRDSMWHIIKREKSPGEHAYTRFIETNDGQILLGSQGKIWRYDPVNDNWYLLPIDVSFGAVTGLLEAHDGSIWIGTEDGIIQWNAGSTQKWTEANGLNSDYVIALLETQDGKIWIGTSEGVSCWDGYSWRNWQDPTGGAGPGEPYAEDRSVDILIEAKDGAIWAATWKGVSRWDGRIWRTWTERQGLADWYVKSILETGDENVWVGTLRGISRWDGSRWRTYTTQDGLSTNYVTTLLESPDGTLWAGTHGGGVNRYNVVEDRWEPFAAD
jgi:ligand-binding sensor domain-containing protein